MEEDKKVNLLKEKLLKAFTKKKLTILADIVDKKDPCSLRLIEWFVSYYAREHRVTYKLNGKTFNVYSSYKDEQMTSFNKKLFDMYRRMPKFPVQVNENRVLQTTVAQLNFFHWMFKNKILDYVLNNLKKIKASLDSAKPGKMDKKFFEDVKVSRVKITIFFD
jgi:hypothetical protein